MFLTETLTIGFTRIFGFQEQKLLARIPSSCCITEGVFIRTAAFSFKSEWNPAVTMVFMTKEKVSSQLLQNIRSCLKDKYIPDRDINTEWDRSQFDTKEDPRGLREEMKLAGVREDNREWKETERVDSLCWKTDNSKMRHRNGWGKIQCLFGDNDCGHNPVLTPEMTVIIAPFGHWKKATAMIECVVSLHFHSHTALPLSVFPHKLQYNTLAGAQLYRARTWRSVCLSAYAAGLGLVKIRLVWHCNPRHGKRTFQTMWVITVVITVVFCKTKKSWIDLLILLPRLWIK